ncbi:DUF2730 family protein [Azospirillum picis]|uniref:Uncharacterized protein YpmS n=1 Tax=Azospirillum picis TaxID=488438 RepID=A0ABU0MNT9_9PROT|nr:DUF2730 family protein [Azospirillum picis]MBP2301294.1 uncharacterized protein YpmS [Azospirillum picis]MDQ0535125.1 uncharacterized protein YpmS [Azospirillum picis]
MDELWKWGWAIVLAINVLLAWVVWTLRAGFVPRAEFARLDTRVALIEQEVKHLPTQSDIAAVRDVLAQVKAQGEAQQQTMTGISNSVRRIEDYMMRATA